MSDERDEELSSELGALLRSARPGVDVPATTRDALFASLLSALPPLPPSGGGGGSDAPAPPVPLAASPPAMSAATAAGGVGVAVSVGAKTAGLVGLIVGAVIGASGHALVQDRIAAPPTVASTPSARATSDRESTPPLVVPTAATSAGVATTATPPAASVGSARLASSSVAAAASVAGAPGVGSARTEPASSGGRDEQLRAEHALIEIARAAVGRGNGAAALVVLDQHAREFPRGRMSEEREGLTIQALLVSGRRADARARLERFRTIFPRSMMLPALEAALP